jgi:tetratricopeptide (TPR) repeat protein
MYWLAFLAIPALALAARPGVSSSRRLLASALALLIPVAGVPLALLVRRVRGGTIALEPVPGPSAPRLTGGDVVRLGELPNVLDRLLSGDPAERLEALVTLASAGDADAVAVLRWAIEHGPSDVVLDAALTLEEIELRNEARLASTGEQLGDADEAEHALAAAEAAATPVLSRVADATVVPRLAEQARAHYQRALAAAPERAGEIVERLARLELAAGRPRAALELLERLPEPSGEGDRLAQLRDDVAFAARELHLLSRAPRPLEVPTDLAACKLQTVLS